MLKRLLALSAGTPAASLARLSSLAPVSVLDGFGRLQPPTPDIAPIAARDFERTGVSAKHPPGLYGAKGVASALNELDAQARAAAADACRRAKLWRGAHHRRCSPVCWRWRALLLCLDALVVAVAARLFPPADAGRRRGAAGACCSCAVPQARADDAMNMKAALDTRLAYVITGLPDLDQVSKAGLTGLGQVLKTRTSYEPQEPIGVDLARDDLSFYPLLYWPMDPREKNLSPAALSKLNDYMRLGGTILFDTRDLTLGAVRGATFAGEQTLRRLTAGPGPAAAGAGARRSCADQGFLYPARIFPAAGAAARSGWKRCRPPKRATSARRRAAAMAFRR